MKGQSRLRRNAHPQKHRYKLNRWILVFPTTFLALIVSLSAWETSSQGAPRTSISSSCPKTILAKKYLRHVIRAEDGMLFGRTIVVLKPNRKTLAAYDIVTGRRRWRRRLTRRRPEYFPSLKRLAPKRLLVHAPTSLTVVATNTGRIIGRHQTKSEIGKSLYQRDGVCGLRDECRMQMIDCQNAKPLGPLIFGKMRRRTRPSGWGCHVGCWGFHVSPIGRAKKLLIFHTSDASDSRKDLVRAIDAKTGKTRWKNSKGVGLSLHSLYGVSPDGGTCWLGTYGPFVAFDCQTGKRLWHRPLKTNMRSIAAWVPINPPGLFLRSTNQAYLLNPRTGKVRWSRSVPQNAHAIPEDAIFPTDSEISLRVRKKTSLLWLHPKTGVLKAKQTLPPDASLTANSRGRVRVLLPSQSKKHNGEIFSPVFTVDRFRWKGPKGRYLDKATLHLTGCPKSRIAVFPRDGWSLGEWRYGTTTYMAIFLQGQEEPKKVKAEIRIYRASPQGF